MTDLPPKADTAWIRRVSYLPPTLLLLLAGTLLTIVATLVLSEFTVRMALRNGREGEIVGQRLAALADWKGLLVDAETGERGFLITHDAAYLEPFTTASAQIPAAELRVRTLVAGHPELEAAVDRMSRFSGRLLELTSRSAALMAEARTDEALQLIGGGEAKRQMDDFRRELVVLQGASAAELRRLRAAQFVGANWARVALVLSTLLSLGLLIVVARQFVGEATRQRGLKEAAELEARKLQQVVADRTLELSQLSTHLQEVSEREKAALARDLHDQLGGLLTAAKMDLSWLQGRTGEGSPDVKKKITALDAGLSEAMQLKRRVVENLRPALLDHFGLPTAMQAYFEETARRAGLKVSADIDEELAVLAPELAITLFRIGQEALANVIQHAGAQNVSLDITTDADNYHVSIADDGRGMDLTNPVSRNSLGMSGIRHRVLRLGGTMEVESEPGKGTRLLIQFPRTPAVTAPPAAAQ